MAWPSIRDTFQLHQSDIAWVFFGTGCSYFVSSFFMGRLLKHIGVGFLLAASSAVVALSSFGYGLAPAWLIFAPFALLHGLGSGAIDAGLNHYAAHHFSVRHMNWLHACYSIGATLGPLIMTGILAMNGVWRSGYLIVAVTLSVLTILFAVTHHYWSSPNPGANDRAEGKHATMTETLRHSTVWLQIMLFFVYTGLEVSAGQWSFTLLKESRRFPEETAGMWVTIYWASIAVGRVLFGFIVERIGIDRLVRLSASAALFGATIFAITRSSSGSAIGLALIGLGLAPIYPCLMTRTPQRIGNAYAAHAIGFQVSAAMLGAAALPSLSGFLAQNFGLEYVAFATIGMALAVFLMHEKLLQRRGHPGVLAQ